MKKRQLHTEDEIEDFNALERHILILIAHWTDPNNPNARNSYPARAIDPEYVNKLDTMLNYGTSKTPKLPEEIRASILQVTSTLFAIINTIDDPNDPAWKNTHHPYHDKSQKN